MVKSKGENKVWEGKQKREDREGGEREQRKRRGKKIGQKEE